MFNITDNTIKKGCYSRSTLLKGLQYYKDDRVIDVDIDVLKRTVHAVVCGTDYYSVQISFSYDDDSIKSAKCDCIAHSEYPGYCKHIIATLFYLKERKSYLKRSIPSFFEAEYKSKKAARDIINFFENKANKRLRRPANIEVNLEIGKDYQSDDGLQRKASFRIGESKLYVIKGISNFIESVESHAIIEFGKNFTYDPHNIMIRDEDVPLINFIKEMYQLEKRMMDHSDYYSYNGVLNGKYIILTPETTARLFEVIGDKTLNVTIMQKVFSNVHIEKKDLPVEFMLKDSGNDLILSINIAGWSFPLTPDGRYIFQNGIIYNISKSQRDSLTPFFNAVSAAGLKDIKFSKKDGEKFASVILPNIEKVGKLKLDDNMKNKICRQPLNAKMYLDKQDKKVTARFDFIYGDIKIDPFENKKENNSGILGRDSLIVRDTEKEKEILDLAASCGFKEGEDGLYMDDDDRIYELVCINVQKFQNLCDVFYSESFKNIKIYNSPSYRTSIRFNEDTDLLEFDFSIDGIDKDSLPQIFASLKRKKKYYRLPDGSFIPLKSEELDNVSDMIESLNIKEDSLKKKVINLPVFRAMYMDDKLNELGSVHIERSKSFSKVVSNIKEPENMEFDVPESLKPIMRGYQVTGFKWLRTLAAYRLGGILADDMGLGKTLQAISFILSVKDSVRIPSIVICPTSLIYNWESEIKKFAPSLKTLIISGNKSERENMMRRINDADVAITSYPLIRRDIISYKNIRFGYCFLDEAQYIKNPNSINAKSVKAINAQGYFALTGTPIENNLTELWSIFDFLMPGYLLSHKKFLEKFERPIMNGNKDALTDLNSHIKPFILRRLKRDVLKELPPKIESVVTAELTDAQKIIYLAYLQNIKGEIQKEIQTRGFEKSQIMILAGLTRLRQICCHPSLFIENYNGGSGKMCLLLELIHELKEGGHRLLLFSQFTQALKLIEKNIEDENISYFYLDGNTKAEDRNKMVNAFNQGFRDVFLISLKAGGTGLNLTGADTVIHFDPWWNPAVEDQATDRAYRIGQENSVQVMKLITKGTIEEKIQNLQQKKRHLINSVIESGEKFISKMTEEDIKELFSI